MYFEMAINLNSSFVLEVILATFLLTPVWMGIL